MTTLDELLKQINMSSSTDEWIEGYVFEDIDKIKELFIQYGNMIVDECLHAVEVSGSDYEEYILNQEMAVEDINKLKK